MNNIIDILVDLANELDNNQAHRMADKITHQIKTASEDYDHEYDMVRNEMETAKRAIDGIEDVGGEEGEGHLCGRYFLHGRHAHQEGLQGHRYRPACGRPLLPAELKGELIPLLAGSR